MSKYVPCHPDKGLKNGRCNIRSCQRPGATWYNFSTESYYCGDCARTLNDANHTLAHQTYGHDLCLAPWHIHYPRTAKQQEARTVQ